MNGERVSTMFDNAKRCECRRSCLSDVLVVVVIVELPQAPEGDPQKR